MYRAAGQNEFERRNRETVEKNLEILFLISYFKITWGKLDLQKGCSNQGPKQSIVSVSLQLFCS